MDIFEVKQSYWEEVYAWATKNGYDFDNPGMNTDPNGITQTGEHPIHSVSWYDAIKWANARSEKDGFTPCYYCLWLYILETGTYECTTLGTLPTKVYL